VRFLPSPFANEEMLKLAGQLLAQSERKLA
jgi:hypothetical protein